MEATPSLSVTPTMEIMVDEVRVRNFRSHKDTKVKLSPLTLLVGANNAGKTSFLRALAVALNGDKRYVSREDLFIGTDGTTGAATQIEIDVKIIPCPPAKTFDEKWTIAFGADIKQDPSGKDFLAFRTIVQFKVTNLDPEIERFVISDWGREVVESNEKLRAKIFHVPLYFIDAKRDLLEDLTAASSYFGRLVKQIQYNEADLKKIEQALEAINQEAVAKSPVLEHLKSRLLELNKTVKNNGSGVEITPFPKRIRDMHKGLKVHFQDGGSDSFSIEYHGMGTRSWASLLAFKAFIDWETELNRVNEEPFFPILALEEPEAHLHPNAQRHLYSQLKSIGGQKIISSHSPYVAGQSELDELRHFGKQGETTLVNQLNFEQLADPELQRLPESEWKKAILEIVRKLKREIFNTRGELIFSKAVVLFEGETEEQSLPIFAKKYWNLDSFELGLSFVGCGGSNYKAFLLILETFQIKWFVFSDYEKPEVESNVKSALKVVGITDPESDSRVFLLRKSYESYLIDCGYQNELKEALIAHRIPVYHNEHHRKAKMAEVEAQNVAIRNLSDVDLLNELEANKTKLSPIYSRGIAGLADESRAIPPKVKLLFDEIHKIL